jgi:aerobic carbon-monoxide dehydrogenase large subunit
MSATVTGGPHVGRAMRRKEDPRMITGRGRYIDDIEVPGTLYAAIVRSPEAHARIVSIDASAAEAREEVVAVLTGDEMAGDFAAPMLMVWAPPGVEINTPDNWPLSRGEVKHVGDPVAVVVGTDRYSVPRSCRPPGARSSCCTRRTSLATPKRRWRWRAS